MNMEVPISARIQQFREKSAAGTITREELKEAVQLLRQGRSAAASAPKKASGGKVSKGPVDADALFDDLDKI